MAQTQGVCSPPLLQIMTLLKLFIYFWLHRVFVAIQGPSLVAANGGCSRVARQGVLIVVASLLAVGKAMATHSSTLAWKVPWTDERARLQPTGVAKGRTRLSDFPHTHSLLWQSTGSREHGLHSYSLQAQESWRTDSAARSMWNLPGTGIEPGSPALAGGFLTTGPLGKSRL